MGRRLVGVGLLLGLLAGAAAAAAGVAGGPVRVPIRVSERGAPPRGRRALLALKGRTRRAGSSAWLEYERARRNATHAIEYYGDVEVGGQPFTVLFDTGSDQLLLPGAQCISDACGHHRRYDPSQSKTAPKDASGSDSSSEDPTAALMAAAMGGGAGGLQSLTFGAGHAAGFQMEDRVCVGQACAMMKFVSALEMSDEPLGNSRFDGVLGLSLSLRKNATRKTSVLEALVDAKAIPSAVFAVFLAKDLHADVSEISLGGPDPARFKGPITWVGLLEPGYWQFSLASLSVGGKDLDLCGAKDGKAGTSQLLANGTNVSSFFGRMCCRTLEEFDREQRCQYWGNSSDSTKRSRYTDSGHILASYPDGRIAVKLHDGCVQKVPKKWLSLKNGCRGDGTVQAVLDTGSSLMMGPKALLDRVTKLLGVKENCTGQPETSFPAIGLELPEGKGTLTMTHEDYMDRVELADGSYCWPHLIEFDETAKGSVLVLGMPFLRAFYTVFDADNQKVGFAQAVQQPTAAEKKEKPTSSALRISSVHLHGRRPGELDEPLAAALRGTAGKKATPAKKSEEAAAKNAPTTEEAKKPETAAPQKKEEGKVAALDSSIESLESEVQALQSKADAAA